MRSPTSKYSFHKWRNDHGGAMLEFAIVLPLLLILVFGIIEFSLLFYNKSVITNASREAAREGIYYYFDDNGTPLDKTDDKYYYGYEKDLNNDGVLDILDIVINYCEKKLISFGNVSEPNTSFELPGGLSTGNRLTVTVTYPYKFLLISRLIELTGVSNGVISLTGETSMLFE